MEYKINKIDTERRKEINEASKEGIVHGYENISIYKNKERKNSNHNNGSSLNYKQKKLLVDATKAEELEIEAFKEEADLKITKGTFLDVKK
ncbi:hypothetical protein [Candidatus Clostridium radicumherbarum]|uniref:Uncharacterized protein n=1 Tax=Candidatus Clostridium radicumherbarum TaxID=3381662 RepID=A0ABW8TWL9_9CLOT